MEKMATKDISCALNPGCGMENHYNITEADVKKKIAAAAFDFKDDDCRLIKWYRKQMADTGVNVLLNTEFKPEDKEKYDEIFVATGAKERKLDIPGFDQPNVRYAVDALMNQNIKDQNVVIVGAGLTGCELAYDLAKKNKKVTLVFIAFRESARLQNRWRQIP